MESPSPYSYPGMTNKKYHSIDVIIQSVARTYNRDPLDLYYPKRDRELVDMRRLVYYLVWKNRIASMSHVARLFGQDHCTALYHVQVCQDLIGNNREFYEKIKHII